MPFTPFHFGPAMLFVFLFFPFFDVAALLLSSVIVDVEPFGVLFLGFPGPLHGFLHTFVGATIMGILASFLVYILQLPVQRILVLFKIRQETKISRIVYTSLFGTYSHVFLDSFLYAEMNPFFPFLGNPLYGLLPGLWIYMICMIGFLIGFLLYLFRLVILANDTV
ncbi:MAG: hypothetical protein KGY80_04345 [Candidatus Thorarchaeota archaeon]|nr:hypothetical protein [Candidatus Thorarchaeota archaeon]